MDIAIPYSGHSSWLQNELRFALRSIESNFKGYGTVYVIGKLPAWAKNIIHIPFFDQAARPNKNIFFKMLCCPSPSFISWHDDHYLLKPLSEFPPHYNGSLAEIIRTRNGRYLNSLINTQTKLKELEKTLRCYDSHIPCVFEKYKLESLRELDWNRDYALKTLYFNIFGPEGNFHPTVKTQLPFTKQELIEKNLTWISSSDTVPRGLSDYLFELFPYKSKFEL